MNVAKAERLGMVGESFEGHGVLVWRSSPPTLRFGVATFVFAQQRQKLVPTEGVEPTHPYG
jgi:hypothetical protein